ncbi:unnamed protein product, partial [Dovyalis caffra]
EFTHGLNPNNHFSNGLREIIVHHYWDGASHNTSLSPRIFRANLQENTIKRERIPSLSLYHLTTIPDEIRQVQEDIKDVKKPWTRLEFNPNIYVILKGTPIPGYSISILDLVSIPKRFVATNNLGDHKGLYPNGPCPPVSRRME